jgi:propionate CoA-transferase
VQDGLELIEIAPGVDLQRDILDRMDFAPVMHEPPALMDPRIFRPHAMGLREDLLAIALPDRLSYDAQNNLLFINFEGHTIRSQRDVDQIRDEVEKRVAGLGHKVFAIVNYDNFTISPDIVDAYTDMVSALVERYYSGVTRYTTSGFLRAKLGDALSQRGQSPYIYESADEARQYLRDIEQKVVE